MLLVPRQLRRAGLTGDVAYYGGRLTPAQAYAASHRRPPSAAPGSGASPGEATPRPARSAADTLLALDRLRDSGVITPEEYDDLLSRTSS